MEKYEAPEMEAIALEIGDLIVTESCSPEQGPEDCFGYIN